MRFWVWDTASMNLVGAYPELEAALAAVRYAVETGGQEEARAWLLEQGTVPGQGEILARGEALIERAAAVTA